MKSLFGSLMLCTVVLLMFTLSSAYADGYYRWIMEDTH